MAGNLTGQVRNIAEVTTAVARGDLSRKITVDVKGEILELKNTINTMVDQLNAFAAEVTRVAREVGTEGKLGGQAQVPGVAGTWKDLTDNVNVMAANLTEQVRGIVKVVTAVANGEVDSEADRERQGRGRGSGRDHQQYDGYTGHLRRSGHNGSPRSRRGRRLGGQANVPGAAGTWKDLTGNVNLLADNLTNQVRAIAEVATAVTKGDLTRSIQVEASGEVAELKDNINTMIDNLRLTTDRNTEQDWLKTNLARFTGMLQGQRDLATVGRMLLSELAPLVKRPAG
jgi:HAMP domain-containing protein